VSALRVEASEELESLEEFRQRARSFIRANLRQVSPEELRWERNGNDDEAELATIKRDREIQRMLFDADLAGICFPREYGGQGLSYEHQRVLNEEFAGYEYPLRVQIPTLSPCAAVILEFGTEEQKLRHLPAILKGEELWMQFLSEPSGGSDVAGALTTAVRDGEQWILNGSKVWTSGAWWSDWGLCLARTNWDQPKHRGLTVFMLPIHQPNVEVHRIEMNNGSREFCQEFMTDVIVPDTDRVGAVDEGWTVGTRWMFHERMLYNSSFVTEPVGLAHGSQDAKIVYDIARANGRLDDALVRDGIGEARMLRLFKGTSVSRVVTLALNTAGAAGAAWAEGDTAAMSAINFLMRQAGSIGGGTTEMARNVISERVLGMPRERRLDKDVPFRDVPRSRPPTT
jgi:alkylation response protein AidB-like acyl-CoA dehydrogenase